MSVSSHIQSVHYKTCENDFVCFVKTLGRDLPPGFYRHLATKCTGLVCVSQSLSRCKIKLTTVRIHDKGKGHFGCRKKVINVCASPKANNGN